MLGVEISTFPFRLRSPQPWSSVRKTTTLGLAAAKDPQASKTKRQKEKVLRIMEDAGGTIPEGKNN